MKTILKSILVSVVLLIAHGIYVFTHKSAGVAQNQNQQNLIQAQRFVYNDYHHAEYIMVGSSLAQLLNKFDQVKLYNLAMAGRSIYDGLELICRQPETPKYVLIEMNLFSKKPDQKLIYMVYNPMLKIRKHYVPLRDEYQPAGLFSAFSIPLLNKLASILKPAEHSDNSTQPGGISYKERIAIAVPKYSQSIPLSRADSSIALLKGYINTLESRGCTVIFFEMPIDTSLSHLPFALETRSILKANFPDTEYSYLSAPDTMKFTSYDGMHLDRPSAGLMCNFIEGCMMKLDSASLEH